jgi:two-component system OmpR family response regulator
MYAMAHKILIVDDDPHIRQVLSFALGKAGMETSEAGDGEAALSAVGAHKPDLVVLDINMPRMDGLEVCRRCAPLAICRSCSCPRATTRSTGWSGWNWARRLCGEALSRRAKWWRRVSAILKRGGRALESGPAKPVSHGRLRLDPEAWEASWDGAAVSGHRDRVSAAAAAGQPAEPGLHPRQHHRSAAWPRLRHHRPDDRQPHSKPQGQVCRARRR